MLKFFSQLFEADGFPPRWHCGRWSDPLGWLHIGSDIGIFVAYMAIPLLLGYVLRRRRDVPRPLPIILYLFIAFILCCGLTHLNEAIIFWHPFYRWAGVAKAVTAAVSGATVIALVPALPIALALKTPASLRQEVAAKTQELTEERDAVARELAARERAEHALQDAESKYRGLYDSAPDMYLSVNPRSGQILECNQTTADVLGYSKQELVGRLFVELYEPSSQEQASAALQQLRETGSTTNAELSVEKKNGDSVAVSQGATARRDNNGQVIEASFALRDVTERRRAEGLFALAVEASPSAMVATDVTGKIVLANAEAEQLFGHRRQELLHQPIETIIPAAFSEEHPRLWKAFESNPKARQLGMDQPLSARHKDGTVFPIELGLNPIAAPQGSILLAAIVDRTESNRQRRELEMQSAELKRSNDDLERFSYAVSHDLRAPLRGMQNAASWIEEDLPKELLSEDLQESLDMLISRARRMEALLSALLEYARAGAGESAVASVDVQQLVEEILDLLSPAVPVQLELPRGLPILTTARPPLEQVLSNLISNALKHGNQLKPKIRIEWSEDGRSYTFSVSDNGPGIDTAQHERIFEVFQTLKPRDELESTGIGLALVKKVVETRGGRVWVESELGRGAKFVFSWPKRRSPHPPLSGDSRE